MYNSLLNQYGYQPHTEIIKVNGENGARTISLAPNSSVLALDMNEPIVWLVQSDGAGYKTATPYDIVPHVTVTLEDRIKRLEEKYESHFTNVRTAGSADATEHVSENAEY